MNVDVDKRKTFYWLKNKIQTAKNYYVVCVFICFWRKYEIFLFFDYCKAFFQKIKPATIILGKNKYI